MNDVKSVSRMLDAGMMQSMHMGHATHSLGTETTYTNNHQCLDHRSMGTKLQGWHCMLQT